MNLKQHPLSAAFPAMSESDIDSLADDIKANSLRQSIILFEGKILDGWHRYLACKKAGVNIRTNDYRGKDPVGYVRSANWHRRHLTASQKAMVEVSLGAWNARGSNQHDIKIKGASATVAEARPAKDIAADAGVSVRTIERAKIVHAEGGEELKEKVKDGKVVLSQAVEQIRGKPESKPPKPAQQGNIAKLEAEIAKLQEQLAQAREAQEAAAEEAERLMHLDTGDQAEFIKQLQTELKTTKAKRDDVMRENSQMRKQIAMLQKKLKV